jgi:hypothetical protein
MSENYSEDQALNTLDSENMTKLISSLKSYLDNEGIRPYDILVYENLIELNDNLGKIGYGYYPGFQSYLVKTLKLLEQVKLKNKDDNLKELVDDAITLINKLFQNYGYEVPEYPDKEYQKYKYPESKFPKYEYYKHKPKDELSDNIGKSFAKHLQNLSNPHYAKDNEIQEQLYSMIDEIGLVHDNKIPLSKTEEYSPEVTKILLEAVQRIDRDKKELEARKQELDKIKNEKITFLSKEQELSNWRKTMLSKVIDQLISEARE